MFMVIAAQDPSDLESWRVKDIKAYTHDDAVNLYNQHNWEYVVVGVALMGGSGHPIHWLNN